METRTGTNSKKSSETVTFSSFEQRRIKHAACKYAIDFGTDKEQLAFWFWRAIVEGAVCSIEPKRTDKMFALWEVYVETYYGFLEVLMKVGSRKNYV